MQTLLYVNHLRDASVVRHIDNVFKRKREAGNWIWNVDADLYQRDRLTRSTSERLEIFDYSAIFSHAWAPTCVFNGDRLLWLAILSVQQLTLRRYWRRCWANTRATDVGTTYGVNENVFRASSKSVGTRWDGKTISCIGFHHANYERAKQIVRFCLRDM